MKQFPRYLWMAWLSFLVLAPSHVHAQLSYGGSPWFDGARPLPMTLPALDRDALAAEDAVTDRYKEAPWRFGVNHTVDISAVSEGALTVEIDSRVWRMVFDAP